MEAVQGGGTQLCRGMSGSLIGQGRVKFQRFPSMETGKWLACLLKREKQLTLKSMGESTPAWGAGAPGVCSHQPLPTAAGWAAAPLPGSAFIPLAPPKNTGLADTLPPM